MMCARLLRLKTQSTFGEALEVLAIDQDALKRGIVCGSKNHIKNNLNFILRKHKGIFIIKLAKMLS